MSSIEKMSIQGIRSFGTGEEKKQLIAFFTPLTLILGPNGTGKTTVIECLKYMTTGEMPPGSRQGGAFIHDPKVARENEVKAQVRLQFRDVRGQVCIASRSLVATQRAKKVEMKTLEGLITRNMPDDTKQSISSKCAEMDREQERVEMKTLDSTIKRKREDGSKHLTYYSVNEISQEMVALLGVAKPVLENVIFCHQEDSNWPLSEGKALKQKFDDIFASTRYVKALEAIRKFRQEQRGQIQVFAKEISYLKQNKDKAAEIQNSLESTETKYLASKESVKELEVQLRPLEESLQKLNNQSQHIYNLNTKIEKLKSEKSQMEKSVQELRGKIENEFTGSTDDLKRALIDFESKVKEREDKLKEYEEKKADLISEAGELSEKKERLLLQQGKLKLEAEQHKKTIDKRDALIRKVAQEYDMDDYSGIITERRVAKFIKELEEKAKQFMADAKTTRERFEEKEAKKQRDLDSARSNKTKLETEQKMKADKIKENQEEIKSLNRKLSEVDASAGRLKDLERDLRRTELEVKDAEKSVNLDSLKSEVAELQKQKGELDAELKVLDAEMSKLSLESAARSQLDIFKKDRTARDEQMRKLKNKNEDSIVHLLGRMPTDNLKRCFDDYVLQKASALNQERTSMQQMQRKLTESETNRKMTMEQLRKKEEELKSHQDDLMEVCESENFDDGLQNLQDKLRKQQDMKGTLEGSAYFYKKYRSSLEKDHPACPFCYRDFEKREDVDNLIGELEKKLSQVPDVLDKVKTSIKQYEAQYNKMLEMKPVRAIMERLEQQEIPQLKTKIKGFSEQIEKLKKNVEEKDEDLESLESDETMAKGLLGDAMMIDKYQSEMRDLDRKISAQSAKLSGGDSGRTMPQVTDEKEELQLQLDNVNRNLDRKRQKISEHSEHLQKLRSTMVELKNQKVQIESDLQQRQHWEEQKLELQNEKETLTVAVQDAKEQLRPLQEKIERLFTEKEELSREKERRFDQDKEQFTKIRDRGREVGTYQKEIEKYIKEGGEQKLEKSEDKMTQLEQAAEKLEKEQKDTNSRIEKIRKDLDTQRMRKRELDDNLLLRKKQKEIQKVDEDIEELDEKLGGLDVRNLEREKRKLNAQLEELMKEKHTAQGRQRGLEDEIKRYKKELKEEQFRDADQKYRNKLIALRTTELANDDLDKYYKALDRSIMSYHRLKMEEINRIIRNLWSNTYKGHDIDTIEIRSDEDDGATSGAAKSRRSYNYRVVMIKGKTVLDMRGRCSAGQKVLASLIIRLALAETFCLNCGILALDEPTTNLDRANIESLATALVDIIRVRHAQRNFQLVVITHDEDFVELLGKSDFVEEFYKVSKTDSGWSKLSRVRIEDIHLHR